MQVLILMKTLKSMYSYVDSDDFSDVPWLCMELHISYNVFLTILILTDYFWCLGEI